MKKGILLIGLFCFCCSAFVQAQQRTPEMKIDTAFVKSYYNDLIVRIYAADKGHNFELTDQSNDLSIRFQPNDYYKLGVGVNYKWFGLKVGAKLPFTNANESVYGKSSSFGLQSYIVARRFLLDVVAMKSRGYYLRLDGKNAGEFVSNDDTVYDLQPSLKSVNFGLNFIYVLNYKRFSYKAAFNQTDMQLKSAGSVILGGGASSLKVGGNEGLISDEVNSDYFEGWNGLNKIQSYAAYAGLGYAYSLVPVRNAIVTAAAMGRIGVRYNQFDLDENQSKLQTKPGFGTEFRLSGGYHFARVYFGASLVRAQFNSDVQFNSLQFSNGTSFLELTISKRIKL